MPVVISIGYCSTIYVGMVRSPEVKFASRIEAGLNWSSSTIGDRDMCLVPPRINFFLCINKYPVNSYLRIVGGCPEIENWTGLRSIRSVFG